MPSLDPVDRLGVDDLTWQEVAEAVWLAAATQPASTQDDLRAEPSNTTPEASDRPQTPDDGTAGTVPDRDTEDDVFAEGQLDTRTDTSASSALRLVTGDVAGAAPGTGWSLPGRLHIVRALRPLKRYVTSQRDVVIDEIATAERAVQDELWWPVTKQRRERWLDLTVVIDACPSMALWRSKSPRSSNSSSKSVRSGPSG